ncbi:hypothetical protein [Streptomyces canus]|uniref:hypothetical protein n=1 Tax=Streptomyces canus TaxID=58343 RepID=UPI002B1DA1A7|nr:hypothetical protein [Streptomyces canus]
MERTAGVQAYYAESAERLGRVYESVSFESVHEALLDLLPEPRGRWTSARGRGATRRRWPGAGSRSTRWSRWRSCGIWPSGCIPAAG